MISFLGSIYYNGAQDIKVLKQFPEESYLPDLNYKFYQQKNNFRDAGLLLPAKITIG